MVQGAEAIGVASNRSLPVTEGYSAALDVTFYEPIHNAMIQIAEGDFAIFYPHDLHMPCISTGNSQPVKKAVFKIDASMSPAGHTWRAQ